MKLVEKKKKSKSTQELRQCKMKGKKYQYNPRDKDNWPSNLHINVVGGNEKIDLKTGNKYNAVNKKLTGKMSKKDLERLRKKFKIN